MSKRPNTSAPVEQEQDEAMRFDRLVQRRFEWISGTLLNINVKRSKHSKRNQ